MTYIKCWSCNRATDFYLDNCQHCGESIRDICDRMSFVNVDDIIQPLYGVGSTPLPHYLCLNCYFVNEVDAKVCKDCGQDLTREKLTESEQKKLKEEIFKFVQDIVFPKKNDKNSESK